MKAWVILTRTAERIKKGISISIITEHGASAIMTTYKTIDHNTGQEIELTLSLTPYEIMNIVYSFLISVKTPKLDFCEEAQEQLTENYNLANIVLGDGAIPDTAREQFLASTFFSMGMKMGKTVAWPVGEQAMEEVAKAKAPRKKGTDATKQKGISWQDKINNFVVEYGNKYPYQFAGDKCLKERELKAYVDTNLLKVRDENLRNKTGKFEGTFKPPEVSKKKLKEAIEAYVKKKASLF